MSERVSKRGQRVWGWWRVSGTGVEGVKREGGERKRRGGGELAER